MSTQGNCQGQLWKLIKELVPLCRKAQEASTWKNQRGNQSEASFPEPAGVRYFHDSVPISKESQIRAL